MWVCHANFDASVQPSNYCQHDDQQLLPCLHALKDNFNALIDTIVNTDSGQAANEALVQAHITVLRVTSCFAPLLAGGRAKGGEGGGYSGKRKGCCRQPACHPDFLPLKLWCPSRLCLLIAVSALKHLHNALLQLAMQLSAKCQLSANHAKVLTQHM